MKVELSAEARAQVNAIDAWWRNHRPSAPALFITELGESLLALAETPGLALAYGS